jgi:nicotinamidase-related amidase
MKMTLLVMAAILTATSRSVGEGRAPVNLHLNLRTRAEPFKGSGQWEAVTLPLELPARETAIPICDMWDRHWCRSATRRCEALAGKMEPVLEAARASGVQIIHAPSDCMEFYKDSPQRRLMAGAPRSEPPAPRTIDEPLLPIDDSDGGCDDSPQCATSSPWKREHPALRVADGDGISDRGQEVYNLMRQRGIRNLIIMGVHTNMCVLGRSFGIRQMTRWGIRCILARDLTDTMYNPRKRPFVSHDEGTRLVVEHIERYWCPSILSADLLGQR